MKVTKHRPVREGDVSIKLDNAEKDMLFLMLRRGRQVVSAEGIQGLDERQVQKIVRFGLALMRQL